VELCRPERRSLTVNRLFACPRRLRLVPSAPIYEQAELRGFVDG
jgi:hypothetical protein